MTDFTYVIYVLKDPQTGEVRYVGKTSDPVVRLGSHISKARSGQTTHSISGPTTRREDAEAKYAADLTWPVLRSSPDRRTAHD